MDLSEILSKKKALEENILKLLVEFKEETSLSPSNLELSHFEALYIYGDKDKALASVEVEVKL